MLAKRFVSNKRKSSGDFGKNILEESNIVPKNDGLEKQNSDKACRFTEILILTSLTMPEVVKGGLFASF